MRRLIVIAAMALAVPAVRGDDAIESARAGVKKLLADLAGASQKRDRAALERVFAEEFVFIHSSGSVRNRAAHVEGILSLEEPAEPNVPLDDLRLYGDVAVLRTTRPGRASTTIYAKKDGRWQIVQVQSTWTPPERKSVAVDPATLDSYVGRYQRSPGSFTVVTRDGDHLVMQSTGRTKVRLGALSATHFFVADNEGEVTFEKNAEGKVTGLVLRSARCFETRGTKIE